MLPTEPAVELFTTDFERGIWKGLRDVFPDPRLCLSLVKSSTYAVYGKVQELGLQVNEI